MQQNKTPVRGTPPQGIGERKPGLDGLGAPGAATIASHQRTRAEGIAEKYHVKLTGDLEPSPHYDFADRLNDQAYVRDRDDLDANGGLYVRLDGYKGHIFAVSPHTA